MKCPQNISFCKSICKYKSHTPLVMATAVSETLCTECGLCGGVGSQRAIEQCKEIFRVGQSPFIVKLKLQQSPMAMFFRKLVSSS